MNRCCEWLGKYSTRLERRTRPAKVPPQDIVPKSFALRACSDHRLQPDQDKLSRFVIPGLKHALFLAFNHKHLSTQAASQIKRDVYLHIRLITNRDALAPVNLKGIISFSSNRIVLLKSVSNQHFVLSSVQGLKLGSGKIVPECRYNQFLFPSSNLSRRCSNLSCGPHEGREGHRVRIAISDLSRRTYFKPS